MVHLLPRMSKRESEALHLDCTAQQQVVLMYIR